MQKLNGKTTILTGTAILAALVVVFDYALKFSGFKIPFPWMPTLKFDFTGIPIMLSFLMFGLFSACTTSLIAFIAIVARSGDLIGASMKALSELITVLGFMVGTWLAKKLYLKSILENWTGWLLGIIFRATILSIVNFFVLQAAYGMPQEAVYFSLPFIVIFNLLQGSISILLAVFLNDAVRRRLGK
jgi:riboflavin transporter FmnP